MDNPPSSLPLNLGLAIETFIATQEKRQYYRGDNPLRRNDWVGFMHYLEQQIGSSTGRELAQELGVNKRTYADWRNGMVGERGIARSLLEGLTTRYNLTPTQERDIWAIAKGDITQGSVASIVRAAMDPAAPLERPLDSMIRNRRIALWNTLQERCGFSNAKLADMTGYSSEGIRQLRENKLQFDEPADAARIAAAFAPEDTVLQAQMVLGLNGLKRAYSPDEIGAAIMEETRPRYQLIALNRLQKADAVGQAARKMGVKASTYARWEEAEIQIKSENTERLLGYICLEPSSPLYAPLLQKLSYVQTKDDGGVEETNPNDAELAQRTRLILAKAIPADITSLQVMNAIYDATKGLIRPPELDAIRAGERPASEKELQLLAATYPGDELSALAKMTRKKGDGVEETNPNDAELAQRTRLILAKAIPEGTTSLQVMNAVFAATGKAIAPPELDAIRAGERKASAKELRLLAVTYPGDELSALAKMAERLQTPKTTHGR